jgi:uncharacterized protein
MNAPYYKFSHYLKKRYGEKVWKISVDAGFSCPNKDCDTGEGGCIFCRLDSFSKVESLRQITVREQIVRGLKNGQERRGLKKFIVYFQASTNTFAPVETLRSLFFDALLHDGVIGLSISTRPDCLPPKVVELIAELSEKTDVWIELGLQSVHNKTLQLLKRGHTFEDYLNAVEKLSKLNVRICTHLMFGLPGEMDQDLKSTAKIISQTPIHEVKLHPLLVIKGTELELMYKRGEFKELELDQYVNNVCDFIELMPPQMVMQRLTAEAPEDILIAPKWSLKKGHVLNLIEREFQKRGTQQGKKYKKLV